VAARPTPPAATTAAKPANSSNDTALEIGGGAAALVALGGIAFALSRRRRDEDEEQWYEEQPYDEVEEAPVAAATEPQRAAAAELPRHDPIAKEQPTILAPAASAFSWSAANDPKIASNDGSDRRPGETWVERAYRGPSPANPSVSLRNRLRRAAFFDKRERDVAEGKAEPVESTAGLPDLQGLNASSERELA
jgi:hypothetical protein